MADIWNHAPGGGPRPSPARSTLRKIIVSVLVGVMSIGVAWAGAGLVPVGGLDEVPSEAVTDGQGIVQVEGDEPQAIAVPELDLAAGQLLAGAAKVSLEPRPDDYGGTWETDPAKCKTLSPSESAVEQTATHVADFRVRWNENPNCIYMGGYGLGPMNPITSWSDEFGLWSRSVAMSDGDQSVVLTLIDAIYWEAHYNSLCDGCGFLDLADQLAAETGLAPESFIFASTHSHTSPDFIGGWGGVPSWYMQQATDSLKASVTQSIAAMQPAVLEAGEVLARQFNGERRDFYRSAEDDGMSWFRLIDADDQPRPGVCVTPSPEPTTEPEPSPSPTEDGPGNGNGNGDGNGNGNGNGKPSPSPSPTPTAEPTTSPSPTPAPTPVCEPPAPGKAIATVAAYGAHPVTADESAGIADADFPGVFSKNVEDSFGGVGMFLQSGLGNLSPRGNKIEMGGGLASLIPAIGGGSQEMEPDIRIGRTAWDQPATNGLLSSLGATGFFDRKFNELPAVVNEGKGPENRKCKSASPLSVRTTVSAAKIGSMWITGGPGELFANLSNTLEERNTNGVTLALALVNDGLGYIIQSFESDRLGGQGAGFVGSADVGPQKVGVAEYEDAYSIDNCFGDAVLEKTIALLGNLP